MEIKDFKPNPQNPRFVTDDKLSMLARALEEFGDLSGFVFNRKTKQLVGGHQRAKVFDQHAAVTVVHRYAKPTRTGTVAEGFVMLKGERFQYREVSWDLQREKAANIAANKGAGDWDEPALTTMLQELSDFGMDLDLTMFDELERSPFMIGDEGEGKDETGKKGKDRKVVECPNCGYIKGLTPGIKTRK